MTILATAELLLFKFYFTFEPHRCN